MLILSLDTTSRAGSVALARDGDVLVQIEGDESMTHGQRLPMALMEACARAGVRVADLDRLAVAAGPGSFTGLRIGIATVQGLAMALDLRIVPVSTLAAIAAAAPGNPPRVAAWMDAQRGEVFAQVFDVAGDAAQPVSDAVSAPPGDVIQMHRDRLAAVEYHGDGAVRYAAVIRELTGASTPVASAVPPLAGAIARLAAHHADAAVAPHAVVPIYVRRPDAEIARDRRSGAR